jgi:hypothetical protein
LQRQSQPCSQDGEPVHADGHSKRRATRDSARITIVVGTRRDSDVAIRSD